MPRVLQAVIYLVGVEREAVCEPGSNLFSWKHARPVFARKLRGLMTEFCVTGAKPQTFRAYNTLNYIDKLVGGLTLEEVEAHHPGFGRLFKWLTLAVATRKQDITRRKAMAERAKRDRDERILLA